MWGAGWREINNGLPSAIAGASGLAIDPTTPSTLYSWGSSGALFKSTNEAGSWNVLSGIAGVSWLVIDPKNSSTIYAGTSRGLLKSANGGASWTLVNIVPEGYLMAPLVLDPQDPNTLYAVTLDAVTFRSGIVKSTDGGASWNMLAGSQALPPIRFLTVDPVTPSTLYSVAVPGRGIFKSTDGGESWISIKSGQGMSGPEFVVALAIDPETPSTIYAAADLWGPGGSSEDIIYKSTDGGQNWMAVRTGISARVSVTSLAIDAGSPFRIYATYSSNRLVATDAAGNVTVTDCGCWGIIKSTDGGETWTVMNAGLLSGNFTGSTLMIDPGSPETLYVGYVDQGGTGVGGIVKSTNGAATWNPANAGRTFIDIRVLVPDPVDADTIYTAVGTDGMFKSADWGANWTKLAAFQLSQEFGFSGNAYIRSLAIDFLRPNTLYALAARFEGASSADRVLFKSTDSGMTWTNSASPLSSEYSPHTLVMDPIDSNSLYLVNSFLEGDSYALRKSTDGGTSWSNLLYGCCNPNALVIDPTNTATLYGGTPAGVLKSTDGGVTWSNIGLSMGVNLLALDTADPRILYAVTGSGLSDFGGLFKSTDGGASWAPINEGLASLIATRSPVTALVIDRANPQLLYAGTSGCGVFQSSDGGAHWRPFNDGLTNLDVRLLALAPGKANALYATTGSGIFAIDLAAEALRLPARSRR
jgi:photosystem II stability/assembly factor-like uncharacterized protein